MSFPERVKEDALVACGRRCCICHEFCGIKMELHHMALHSEGGKDTAENCIPLCFDCHSEQSSYDKKHPKGTKYTPQELTRQRDSWYTKVAAGLADPVQTDDHRELDREVFRSIRRVFPHDGPLKIIRASRLQSSDDRNAIVAVYNSLKAQMSDPGFEFIDRELEEARANFADAVIELYQINWTETMYCTFLVDEISTPDNYKDGTSARFAGGYEGFIEGWSRVERNRDKAGKALRPLAEKVLTSYDYLIKAGRRRTGIDGR